MTYVLWQKNPEMVAFMMEFVLGHSWRQISKAFFERFGIELTRGQIKSFKHRYGVKCGVNGGRFNKGSVSPNKGRPQSEWMSEESREKCKPHWFKPGHLPRNAREIGEERETKDGYIEVHVSQRRKKKANDQWVFKHRLVWEQANRRELKPGEIVLFADGDQQNFDPDNLVAVTRVQNLMLRNMGCSYSDRETLEAALAVVDLKLAVSQAKKRPRACKACGVEFEPRFAHQARCDTCIKAGRQPEKKRAF